MVFPPPPVNTIDWSNVGFKIREVNGHVESHYSVETGKWTAPEFVADPFMRIHGMCPGLNYGQQCYEGLKAFRSPEGGINIFRPSMNAQRMAHSAGMISIPAVPEAHWLECVKLAVALNAEYVPPHETGAALYIRPLLFGSSAQLGLSPPQEYTFCVFVVPTGVYHGTAPVKALILEDFDRAAPDGTGSAKVGGNYAPVLKWSEKAYKEGYGITLHLDSKERKYIDEFSTSGFVGIKQEADKVTLVVPASKAIIKSVTSESVTELAKFFGWTVERRPIPYSELSTFTEILAAGTAAALVPIKSIHLPSQNDTFIYGTAGRGEDNEPGPCCVRLLTNLKGIQLGKIQDKFGWCVPVHEAKAGTYKVRGATGERSINGSDVDVLP